MDWGSKSKERTSELEHTLGGRDETSRPQSMDGVVEIVTTGVNEIWDRIKERRVLGLTITTATTMLLLCFADGNFLFFFPFFSSLVGVPVLVFSSLALPSPSEVFVPGKKKNFF